MLSQKITFDLMQSKLDDIRVVQGDSCREILFEGSDLDGVMSYDDYTYEFDLMKSDGTFVIQTLSAGILIPTEQMEVITGTHYYSVKIKDADNELVYSGQGAFIVDDNVITEDAIESVAEVNGLIFPDDFLTVNDHVAFIDDDTVSEDSTWSSDKISEEIESHAGGDVSKTVSGNPVTFTDGANAPLVKCVTAITGSQDLHGYEKPWVGGAGKNLLSYPYTDTTKSDNGIQYTDNGDGTIKAYGLSTSRSTFIIRTLSDGYDLANGDYILSKGFAGGISLIVDGYNNGTWVKNVARSESTNEASFTIDHDGYNQIRIYIEILANTNVNETFYPMIRKSTAVSSTWEPYSNICPITAYTEGEIEVRGKNLAPSSPIEIGQYVNGNFVYFNARITSDYMPIQPNKPYTASIDRDNINDLAFINYAYFDKDKTFLGDRSVNGEESFNGQKTHTCIIHDSRVAFLRYTIRAYSDPAIDISGKTLTNAQFMVEAGSTTTDYEPYTSTTHTTTFPYAIYRGSEDVVNGEVITEWGMIASYAGETLPNEWISDRDEYAPGTTPTTGAQVAYKLATPTSTSVTTTNLPIKSLSGYTHIESSTGDMEVEYITAPYQPLIDSISQLI